MILSPGFRHNNADKCTYSKFTNEYGVTICLYIDGMLIGTSMLGVNETKDLNKVETILGGKVKKSCGAYALCQSHYVGKNAS